MRDWCRWGVISNLNAPRGQSTLDTTRKFQLDPNELEYKALLHTNTEHGVFDGTTGYRDGYWGFHWGAEFWGQRGSISL